MYSNSLLWRVLAKFSNYSVYDIINVPNIIPKFYNFDNSAQVSLSYRKDLFIPQTLKRGEKKEF